MVKRRLPKPQSGVRFPSSAPFKRKTHESGSFGLNQNRRRESNPASPRLFFLSFVSLTQVLVYLFSQVFHIIHLLVGVS